MISLKNIHKSYTTEGSKMHVLRGINAEVEKGEMVSIMGSSGSGKSTLLNILGILDNYDEGEYKLAGETIKSLSETHAAQLRNQLIGFVFQSFNLISFKNAMENVALPLVYAGLPKKIRTEMAQEVLRKVDLMDRSHHKPNELSGGQCQRVAIARALVNNPSIILADEPTGNLDTKTSYEIMSIFAKIHDEGNTVVLVTHEEDISNFY